MSLLKAVVIAVASFAGSTGWTAESGKARSCRPQNINDVSHVVCTIDPTLGRLRLFWKSTDGQPYRSFSRLAEAVAADGKSLVFAINAGMYADDFSPMGLYIEDGQELRPANTIKFKPTAGVVPSFYKAPNGVFFVDGKTSGILQTDVFLERRAKVTYATQSGPMLVISGKINPIFIPGSKDRTRRSGVGICEGGLVRFAISDAPINFHDFAKLFRDTLKCSDALFLDGGRGAGIFVPKMDREDWSGHGGYGPIIGLVK